MGALVEVYTSRWLDMLGKLRRATVTSGLTVSGALCGGVGGVGGGWGGGGRGGGGGAGGGGWGGWGRNSS